MDQEYFSKLIHSNNIQEISLIPIKKLKTFLNYDDAHKNTPLINAVRRDNYALVNLILSKLSPEEKFSHLTRKNDYNRTALSMAGSADNVDIAKLIMSYLPYKEIITQLIDIDHGDNTVLMWGSHYGNLEMIKLVLSTLPLTLHLGQLTYKNRDGNTVINLSVKTNDFAITKFILTTLKYISKFSKEHNDRYLRYLEQLPRTNVFGNSVFTWSNRNFKIFKILVENVNNKIKFSDRNLTNRFMEFYLI